MSKQMRAKLTPWIAALALLALVALTAVPGFAASPTNKLFTIDVAGPSQTIPVPGNSVALAGADQTFKFKITNQTPGSSNMQSAILSAPIKAPSTAAAQNIFVKTADVNRALSNNGNNNGANPNATLRWLDKNNVPQCTKPASMATCPTVGVPMIQGKVYVQNIDPVKSANNLHQFITFNITLTMPSVSSCASAITGPDWNAVPINGNSLSGDTFAMTSGEHRPDHRDFGTVRFCDDHEVRRRERERHERRRGIGVDRWLGVISVYDSSNQLVTTQTTGASGSVTFSLPGRTDLQGLRDRSQARSELSRLGGQSLDEHGSDDGQKSADRVSHERFDASVRKQRSATSTGRGAVSRKKKGREGRSAGQHGRRGALHPQAGGLDRHLGQRRRLGAIPRDRDAKGRLHVRHQVGAGCRTQTRFLRTP